MDFIDHIKDINWSDIADKIYSKNSSDVEKALAADRPSVDDFMALISPAASGYVERMAVMSNRLTQKRFGKTVQLYVPLYLSNYCENQCVYCGFNSGLKIPRKVLTIEEVKEEAIAISKMGFKHILLVTGESSKKADVDYLEEVFKTIKPYFSLISIEVQPLSQNDYERLLKVGLHTVYIYQETYNSSTYSNYHLKGKKSSYSGRLDTYEKLGRAGVYKMGLGILAGLEDWRVDTLFTALHLRYLQKRYWRTKYSISFPRLRPNAGGYEPSFVMTDKDLAQLIFAYRIFDNDVELALSTREDRLFRDNMINLGVTSMSAGSKTNPGGYAHDNDDLEQFSVNDDRTPVEVAEAIKDHGYEPVWKDWDSSLQ
jgi:2-iminoacetate synthase